MNKPVACLGLVIAAGAVLADTTAQSLPLVQDWTNAALITAPDDWSGVPGIIGYRGDGLAVAGADPQLVVADGSGVIDVNPNVTSTTFATGGVTEFDIPNPTIGLKGSGTADAPHIVLATVTTGIANVRVRYTVRDLDGGPNNSVQRIALQYRAGTTGDFTNVAAGFVPDATTGPDTNGPDLPIDVVLPAAAGNQPVLHIRIITADATGVDEYVGIDNILVTDASGPPTAVASAMPSTVPAGGAVTLFAVVTPGTFPTSTGLTVICHCASIGGSDMPMFDDGTNGDVTAGDNTFTLATTVGATTPAGTTGIGFTVSDTQGRATMFATEITVPAVCGDGRVEGTEVCDDDDTSPGDGCSATCTVETGYTCTGTTPSVCVDNNECTLGTDTCDDNATCTNTPGSFTCACNSGYSGDGMACASVCGDGIVVTGEACDDDDTAVGDGCSATCTVETGWTCDSAMPSVCTDDDECTLGTDTCDDNATCTNTPGTFTCECDDGYTGDGMTCVEDVQCGDGVIDTGEACDDGGADAGDGCSASCEIEASYTCSGEPSTCIPDRDADGIANASDNCPMTANPSQADSDGDGVGDACEATPNPDDGDGGGCCSSGSDNTGGIVLAFGIALVLRRRRARCEAAG